MNQFEQLTAQDKPTLVDMYATWCGPCKMMHPILEEVKSRLHDRATVLKVDVDQNQALAQRLGVQAVPTLIIFKSGQVVWRQSGVQSAEALVSALQRFV